MGTAVARILELWSSAAEEESMHVPLLTAVQGLTAAQAAWSLHRIQCMALHDAYHCGQICYLRALQGIPAKGSWDDAT